MSSLLLKNTGMPERNVERIKDHLFFKEYIKEHGVGRFDPDYQIAEAWNRLPKGTYNKNDIDLLNHELFGQNLKVYSKQIIGRPMIKQWNPGVLGTH